MATLKEKYLTAAEKIWAEKFSRTYPVSLEFGLSVDTHEITEENFPELWEVYKEDTRFRNIFQFPETIFEQSLMSEALKLAADKCK